VAAEAECSWVLWATAPDVSLFIPYAGFKSKESCEEQARANNVAALQDFRNSMSEPRIDKDGKWSVTARPQGAHICLPDTIDPRAPKR